MNETLSLSRHCSVIVAQAKNGIERMYEVNQILVESDGFLFLVFKEKMVAIYPKGEWIIILITTITSDNDAEG